MAGGVWPAQTICMPSYVSLRNADFYIDRARNYYCSSIETCRMKSIMYRPKTFLWNMLCVCFICMWKHQLAIPIGMLRCILLESNNIGLDWIQGFSRSLHMLRWIHMLIWFSDSVHRARLQAEDSERAWKMASWWLSRKARYTSAVQVPFKENISLLLLQIFSFVLVFEPGTFPSQNLNNRL